MTHRPGAAQDGGAPVSEAPMAHRKAPASGDFAFGVVWIVLAVAIVIGAWRMDRLEHLQASIYSAPGLVPGLIGVTLGILGTALLFRAVRAGALADRRLPRIDWRRHGRLAVASVLCLAFALLVVGRGPPFWLGAAGFVAVTVVAFQLPDRLRERTLLRGIAFALLFGLGAGLAIQYVFQDLFLVRLP
jgi:hypothetical protein